MKGITTGPVVEDVDRIEAALVAFFTNRKTGTSEWDQMRVEERMRWRRAMRWASRFFTTDDGILLEMGRVKYCRQCNSNRRGHYCWKCGGETRVPCEGWEFPDLLDVQEIRGIAKEVGYGIGLHGSQERDLDLIAVPWTKDAVGFDAFVEHLQKRLNGRIVGTIERKPYGRLAFNFSQDSYTRIVDISVIPPHLPEIQQLAEEVFENILDTLENGRMDEATPRMLIGFVRNAIQGYYVVSKEMKKDYPHA